MAIVPIKKDIMLFDGKKISIDVDIPIDGPIMVDEEGYEAGVELLINQYYREVKRAIEAYNKSDLPSSFIDSQKFLVKDVSYYDYEEFHRIYGLYNYYYDIILFDPDAISGIWHITPEFLIGHEVGHKIAQYKMNDEDKEEIRSLLGLCTVNEHIIQETFADACGDIVNNKLGCYYQFLSTADERQERLKRIALKTSYRC